MPRSGGLNRFTSVKKFIFILALLITWISCFGTYSPQSFHMASGRLTNDWTTTATTVSNVTGMNFQISSNEVWQYDFVLRAGSSSTAGIKFALNFPSGAACMGTISGTSNTAASTTSSIITAAATLTTEVYVAFSSQAGIIYISGIVTNGATSGMFQLQGAKVTSGTMNVNSNSYYIAQRIL